MVVLALLTVVGFAGYGRLPAVTVTCGIAAGHAVEVPLDAPTDSWREAVTAGVASADERESIVAACERQQDTTGNYRFNRGNGAGRRQMAAGRVRCHRRPARLACRWAIPPERRGRGGRCRR